MQLRHKLGPTKLGCFFWKRSHETRLLFLEAHVKVVLRGFTAVQEFLRDLPGDFKLAKSAFIAALVAELKDKAFPEPTHCQLFVFHLQVRFLTTVGGGYVSLAHIAVQLRFMLRVCGFVRTRVHVFLVVAFVLLCLGWFVLSLALSCRWFCLPGSSSPSLSLSLGCLVMVFVVFCAVC